jgi:O-antigen biosynthesis protein WbqV
MIRLAGLRPEIDIAVEITGMRPGEREHEQLFDDAEVQAPTPHSSVIRLLPRVRLGYDEIEALLLPLRDFSERDVDAAAVSLLEQVLQRAGVGCELGSTAMPATTSLVEVDIDLTVDEVEVSGDRPRSAIDLR